MRYGGFVQDIWRLNDRTTLNLGLRYDLTRGDIPAITKEASSAFLVSIGEAYMKPAYGINPFGELKYDGWKNPIPWHGFAPQIGVAYDLFGNHKTALKAHWGRYQNNLPGWNFDGSEPSSPWTFAYNWWDNNHNGKLDAAGVDAYEQADSTNPIAMLGGTWKQAIDPNLKTPYLDEFMVGVDHEIATDVRLSVDYMWRNWGNLLSNPYYDLDTGKYWSNADSGYWVPFNTTVPAYGTDFPAVPMTVYFQKANAPDQFTRLTNIDAAKATYQALNISVNKRMSHNWQLGGSFVYSKMAGNYPGTSGAPSGFFQTPNYSINRMGRIAIDRPIQVKLWGSAALPFQTQASFFYTFLNGTPWGLYCQHRAAGLVGSGQRNDGVHDQRPGRANRHPAEHQPVQPGPAFREDVHVREAPDRRLRRSVQRAGLRLPDRQRQPCRPVGAERRWRDRQVHGRIARAERFQPERADDQILGALGVLKTDAGRVSRPAPGQLALPVILSQRKRECPCPSDCCPNGTCELSSRRRTSFPPWNARCAPSRAARHSSPHGQRCGSERNVPFTA